MKIIRISWTVEDFPSLSVKQLVNRVVWELAKGVLRGVGGRVDHDVVREGLLEVVRKVGTMEGGRLVVQRLEEYFSVADDNTVTRGMSVEELSKGLERAKKELWYVLDYWMQKFLKAGEEHEGRYPDPFEGPPA